MGGTVLPMTKERWIGIAVAVATVVATLLLLALLPANSRVSYDCTDPTERERIREIALKGIDDGLQNAISHLFDVWQKDPTTSQPQRAQVGTTNAINAHIRARQHTLAWSPPICDAEKPK
jgi:hypothetical protein